MYTRQFASRAFEVMQLGESALSKSEYPLQERPGEAIELFRNMDYDDRCEDADLVTVVHYLRGCHSLKIPEDWRAVLPKRL